MHRGPVEAAVLLHVQFANSADEIELVYPFWVIKDKNTTVMIDTGFSERMAGEKGVFDYLSPSELLPRVGLDPKDLKSIVISHLHYDHFCVPERYPNATFYVQSDDIEYFTGRGVTHPAFKSADQTAIDQIGRLRSDGKIKAMSGDFNMSPLDQGAARRRTHAGAPDHRHRRGLETAGPRVRCIAFLRQSRNANTDLDHSQL